MEVGFFSLDAGKDRLNELRELLSFEELERAARFRFDRDRNRFIACRGILRKLLGFRENFVYGPFGKPMLPNSDVHFNVSHSHGMAMIAVTRGGEVGCDIERIDASFADDKIPERFFSTLEVAALRALPIEHQCQAFFRCWTRKEAYIKACGMGMSMALDSFDVTLGAEAQLLRGAEGWSFHAVDAPAGYAAALAVGPRLTCFSRSCRRYMSNCGCPLPAETANLNKCSK